MSDLYADIMNIPIEERSREIAVEYVSLVSVGLKDLKEALKLAYTTGHKHALQGVAYLIATSKADNPVIWSNENWKILEKSHYDGEIYIENSKEEFCFIDKKDFESLLSLLIAVYMKGQESYYS